MGVTAIGALIGSAAIAAPEIAGAVAAVGAATAVVGAVTGNDNLTKAGAAMGLVGGVGGMLAGAAEGAEGAATAGSLAESAAPAAADLASASAADTAAGLIPAGGEFAGSTVDMGAAMGEATGNAAMGGAITQSVPNMASQVAQELPTGAMDMEGSAGTGLINSSLNAPTTQMVNTLPGAAANAAPAMQQMTQAASPMPAAQAASDTGAMDMGVGTQQVRNMMMGNQSMMSSNSFFDGLGKVGDFLEKNKMLTYAGLQVAGSMMSNAQKQAELDRQYDLQRQKLALAQQEQYNRSQAAPGIARGIIARRFA